MKATLPCELLAVLDVLALMQHDPTQPQRREARRLFAADIRAFCDWYWRTYGAMCDLDALSTEIVLRYRAWCASRLSRGTFNRRRTSLKRLCQWVVQHGWLAHNPVNGVPCLK